jgi:hypothetical protein
MVDQFGQTFAYWAIVFFGQFFLNGKRGHNFLIFSPIKITCIKFIGKWATLSNPGLPTPNQKTLAFVSV